jgi:hypothetical protein
MEHINYAILDFVTNKTIDFSSMPQSEYALYEEVLERNTTPIYRSRDCRPFSEI